MTIMRDYPREDVRDTGSLAESMVVGGRVDDPWREEPQGAWLRIGAEWDDAPEWLRTTITPTREALLFLVWIEERLLLSRQKELRAVDAAEGFLAALWALTPAERGDWLAYRGKMVWRLADRFDPEPSAVALYTTWGYALSGTQR
jgi:hypothetical protein